MDNQQRLILCLDGTWNNEDDSTNVLHHFNLVVEGAMTTDGVTVTQKKKYQRGVGTGVLDKVSGGGFGFGLEENVRDAYNWLVENYHEGDEIFVFGFSRGAFTARSLVGFIGRCGLLRRAAPVTVGQLWKDYCILGREREERPSFSQSACIRQITELVWDPWLIDAKDQGGSGRVPGQRVDDLNETEKLVVRWSRRVKITYLGVYDTVGAIGWDALAFPILKSHLATHHNVRPTTIIQSCRHALAIQEHRTSFNHTPFLAFVGHAEGDDEIRRAADSRSGASKWDATIQMWKRKIEQRWFVGAHSNIGGGYENNRLASLPFRWMLEGAVKAGLKCEAISEIVPLDTPLPPPRDSYAEFVPPLWTLILRAKRNYRLIDPEPLPQASRTSPSGFSLHTINELIDDSVSPYFGGHLPPNLFDYYQRHPQEGVSQAPPQHEWFGEGRREACALVLWASLAGAGAVAIGKLIWSTPGVPLLWIACAIAFLLPIVDWGESRVNFMLALGKVTPRRRAFLDSVYWTRTFGVVFFFIGAVYTLVYVWRLGWGGAIVGTLLDELARFHWAAPLFATAGLMLANLLDGASKARWKSGFAALWISTLVACAGAAVVFLISAAVHAVFPGLGIVSDSWSPVEAESRSLAAMLMLLEFAFFYYIRAFSWVGDPLANANLGSILPLQMCKTAPAVRACLETWRQRVVCHWSEDEDPVDGPAAKRVRAVVEESLWRDIIGFIPVYSLTLGFGLWFAARKLGWPWLQDWGAIPVWPVLPLVALVADYLEDAFHLSYFRRIDHDQSPAFAWLSWTMTILKLVAFIGGLILSVAAVCVGAFEVERAHAAAGWRGPAALLIFILFVIALVFHIYKMVKTRSVPKTAPAKAAT